MKLSLSPALLLIVSSTLSCCTSKTTSDKTTAPKTIKTEVAVPVFNEDSAFNNVRKQLEFGNRIPNTKEHAATAEFLAAELKRHGAEVIVQNADVMAYDKTILHAKNIIGSFNTDNPDRILLFAHWDSRPFADHDPNPLNHKKPVPGANDGASGVGVLLEIARLIGQAKPNVGIDIFFTDAEDYGTPDFVQSEHDEDSWALGTQYWAKRPHRPGYQAKYGILLDMVGGKDAQFAKEGFSMKYASNIVDKVWGKAKELGYSNYFVDRTGGYITDDHVYVNRDANIPSIDIIQYDSTTESGFYPYWHTVDDTLDKIDPSTLKAVGQTVLTTIYSENQ